MVFRNTPVLQALLALCTGIMIADSAGPVNLTILMMVGIFWFGGSLLLLAMAHVQKTAEYLFSVWSIGGCMLLGCLIMYIPQNKTAFPDDADIYIEGVIRDAVEWRTSHFSFDGSTNVYAVFELDVYRATIVSQYAQRVDERIWCTVVSVKPVPLQRGDRIGVQGHWKRIKPATNPGEFDAAVYYYSRGIQYRFTARKGVMKWAEPEHISFLLCLRRWLDILRDRCAEVFAAPSALHTETLLMKRMLLGVREPLPEYISEIFTKTSTFHIIAISGLHIGIIWSLWWGIAWLAGISGKFRGIVLLPILWLYGSMVGFRPSVIRAVLMFSGLAAAPLCRRGNSVLNTLIATAFMYLLIYPRQLGSFGTLLTFLSVIALIAGAPLLDKVLVQFSWYRGPDLYDFEHRRSRILHSIVRYVTHILCGTCAIWIVTWPIILTRNNLVTPASWLANLLLVPATGIILAGGFTTLFLSMIWPSGAVILKISTLILLKWLLIFIDMTSRIPGGYFSVRTLTAHTLFWYYFALGTTYVWGCRSVSTGNGRSGITRLLGVASLAAWLTAVWCISSGFSGERTLRIVTLDVGLGDATVIHTPGGHTLLVDSGVSYGPWSMGNRVVVPYLRSAGVNSLDAVICSHFDKDHVGGLRDVLNLVPVGRMYSACRTQDDAVASLLKTRARHLGIEWHEWFAGTTVQWDEVTCIALHPPGSVTNWLSDAARWGDNTWSLVIQGTWQEKRFLLTGDADEAGEAIQLNRKRELHSDLLKIGHHGSATSSSEPYISAVRPSAVSIGTGPNAFGLPAPQVIERLNEKGIAVMRTDIHGAIEYRFESGKLVIYTFNEMAHVTTCTN